MTTEKAVASLAPERLSDSETVCTLTYHDMFLEQHEVTVRRGETCVVGYGSRYTVNLNGVGMREVPRVATRVDMPMDECSIEFDKYKDVFTVRLGGFNPDSRRDDGFIRVEAPDMTTVQLRRAGIELPDVCVLHVGRTEFRVRVSRSAS